MGEQQAPSRWTSLLAFIPLALLVAVGAAAPNESYLTRLYFAGDGCRWPLAAGDFVDRFNESGLACEEFIESGETLVLLGTVIPFYNDVRDSLYLDLVFAASFAIVGFVLLSCGRVHWAPLRRRGRRWIWRFMPAIAVTAGGLDLVETSGQLIWLEDASPPFLATHLIAAIAWWKWIAYLLALIGLFGLVIGPIAAPAVRPVMRSFGRLLDRREPTEPATPSTQAATEARTHDGRTLGITASGGGIRSAAVMAGAMRGLTKSGAFGQARWLHAVSGGGYTAAGWRASSVVQDDVALFDANAPWYRSVRRRRRFLDNGVGSMLGGVFNVVVRLVLVLGAVMSVAVLAGWCAGWLTRSWAVLPAFSNGVDDATPFDAIFSWRLILPGAIPLTVGVAAMVSHFGHRGERWRRSTRAVAIVAGGLGVLLLVALVAVPLGIRLGRPALEFLPGGKSNGNAKSGAEDSARILGAVSALGLVAAVRQMLTSEVKKRWSRLGGVLLGLGLFGLAGKVADDQANADMGQFFAGNWAPIVAVVWLLVVNAIPSHRLTLNGVYRKRISETFFLTNRIDARGEPVPIGYFDEPEWNKYVTADGPELVLCATGQSSRVEPGGVPAVGFSFGRRAMTIHNEGADPDHPGERRSSRSWMWSTFRSDVYELGSSWDGYPRRLSMSRAMALAGAAFSSAMGRQSFGTTNSLLSALNLRLGMWVPNPNRADWFVDRNQSPRVHLGYFAKELFNRYDPADDAFVYVTDGGHRDNLGVVEQLRERPDRMIILDASGDSPGGFGTMRGAMQLADSELGVEVELDWDPITWPQPPERDVPRDVVTRGTATFREPLADESGPHVTEIIYAKAQVADSVPILLRQFAAGDPDFPDYSTIDQYLSAEEWDALVELGEHMAERINAVGGFENSSSAEPRD